MSGSALFCTFLSIFSTPSGCYGFLQGILRRFYLFMAQTFQREIGGHTLTIEVGRLLSQSNGSVTVRYGDSVVLVNVTAPPKPRENIDFLPLTVDYEERLYAVGRIPGSFFRREGRPSTEAILADRLTDRTLRPLFPKGFRHEVQIIVHILSADLENPCTRDHAHHSNQSGHLTPLSE